MCPMTVLSGLRIYCADRKNVIQEYKNPIANGDFKWIFVSNNSAHLNCYPSLVGDWSCYRFSL